MKLYVKKNVLKYDKIYKSGHDHSYPNLDLVRILSSYVNSKNTNILDYGFGTGQNLIHLTKLGFKKVYGLEASGEAIKLVNRKLKKLKKKNILLKKISNNDKFIPFQDNFFDSIICTSVLSLLENRENAQYLLNEFHRILKLNGKLIIDINGPNSGFRKNGKFISEDTFQTYIRNKRQKVVTYCPKSKRIFSKLFKNFAIDQIGEVRFNYFSFYGHEYIACLRKK